MWRLVISTIRRHRISRAMLASVLILAASISQVAAESFAPIHHVNNVVTESSSFYPIESESGFYGSGGECAMPIAFEGGGFPVDCPTPKPVCELQPGRSLYWHDICCGGYRGDESLFHDATRPNWYVSLEAVALFRDQLSGPNVRPIVPASALVVETEDFDTEFAGGARVFVGRSIGDWYRVDFSWLGGFEWTDTILAQSPNEFHSIGFHSQLNTAELNLRRRVRIRDFPQHYPDYCNAFEFSTILGLRFLDLQERADYRGVTIAANRAANVQTENQAVGAQIGGLAQWLYEDRGWLDLEIKGAVLSNQISSNSQYVSAPVGTIPFTNDENQAAFLVDASMVFNYQFTPTTTLRLGYNMIWISGLTLATGNVSPDASNPNLNVNHDGESVFHGPSIGLVLTR